MSTKDTVSLVVLLYNEAALLHEMVPTFIAWAYEQSKDWEVLLVENGSTDESSRLVDGLAQQFPGFVRAIHLPTASFGAAMRTGILEANKPYIIKLDADWLDQEFVLEAKRLLDTTTVDVVVGSKGLAQSQDERPIHRKLLTSLLIFLIRLLFGYKGKSMNGLKAFRANNIKSLTVLCRSNEIIESELVLRAVQKKLDIKEVPVVISEIRAPRIGLVRRAFRVVRELTTLRRILDRTGLYLPIHADDGGYNDRSVDSLIALMKVKRVESISVMAGWPATKRLADYVLSLPSADRPAIFLHANIVEGEARASESKKCSLTDEGGMFFDKEQLIWHALTGSLSSQAVERELQAQLDELLALGLQVVGIDTHQHMHALAPVADAVARLAETHNYVVRDFRDFKTVTPRGRLKLFLLALIARITELRLHGTWRLPQSWRSVRRWKPFAMATWELVDMINVPDRTIIVYHPLLSCDKREIR